MTYEGTFYFCISVKRGPTNNVLLLFCVTELCLRSKVYISTLCSTVNFTLMSFRPVTLFKCPVTHTQKILSVNLYVLLLTSIFGSFCLGFS